MLYLGLAVQATTQHSGVKQFNDGPWHMTSTVLYALGLWVVMKLRRAK
jgi:hypothetical protein